MLLTLNVKRELWNKTSRLCVVSPRVKGATYNKGRLSNTKYLMLLTLKVKRELWNKTLRLYVVSPRSKGATYNKGRLSNNKCLMLLTLNVKRELWNKTSRLRVVSSRSTQFRGGFFSSCAKATAVSEPVQRHETVNDKKARRLAVPKQKAQDSCINVQHVRLNTKYPRAREREYL